MDYFAFKSVALEVGFFNIYKGAYLVGSNVINSALILFTKSAKNKLITFFSVRQTQPRKRQIR